jgi:hypothetical protein
MHSVTALLRSASGSIIALFFPPSSIRHGFRFSPHALATFLPVLALPVKLIFLTAGCAIIMFATSGAFDGGQVRMLSTPGGSPASEKALPIAQ